MLVQYTLFNENESIVHKNIGLRAFIIHSCMAYTLAYFKHTYTHIHIYTCAHTYGHKQPSIVT